MSATFYRSMILFVSIVISFILSNTADATGSGLGALFNLFIPPVLGIITIVLFFLSNYINKTAGLIVLILTCWLNVSVGLMIHIASV